MSERDKPPQDVFNEDDTEAAKPVVKVTLNVPKGVELDLAINGVDVFLGNDDAA